MEIQREAEILMAIDVHFLHRAIIQYIYLRILTYLLGLAHGCYISLTRLLGGEEERNIERETREGNRDNETGWVRDRGKGKWRE